MHKQILMCTLICDTAVTKLLVGRHVRQDANWCKYIKFKVKLTKVEYTKVENYLYLKNQYPYSYIYVIKKKQ